MKQELEPDPGTRGPELSFLICGLLLLYVPPGRNNVDKQRGHSFGGAMVLTGLDLRPMDYVEELLKMHDIPVIVSNLSTFDTMDRIRRRE